MGILTNIATLKKVIRIVISEISHVILGYEKFCFESVMENVLIVPAVSLQMALDDNGESLNYCNVLFKVSV